MYRATDADHQRHVAVKLLDGPASDSVSARRFERERALLGRLSEHPHVVTLLDSGRAQDGRPFLVMEYLSRGSLADRLRAAPLGADEATSIAIDLAGALQTAHAAGVLHRDVTPANVLCSELGEWKLADFGVARLVDHRRTRGGEVVASLAHAAPETFGPDPVSAASDLYGLASTLYSTLTGVEPFAPEPDESPLAAIHRIATRPAPDARAYGVDDAIAGLLEQSLAKDPLQRSADALQFAEALNDVRATLGYARREPRVGSLAAPAGSVGLADHPSSTGPVAFLPLDDAGASAEVPRVVNGARGGKTWMVSGVAAVALAATGTMLMASRGDDGATSDVAQPVAEAPIPVTPAELPGEQVVSSEAPASDGGGTAPQEAPAPAAVEVDQAPPPNPAPAALPGPDGVRARADAGGDDGRADRADRRPRPGGPAAGDRRPGTGNGNVPAMGNGNGPGNGDGNGDER